MVLYGPLILAVKLSLLWMLARFFEPYRRWVTFIYVFSGVLGAYTIAATTAKICICQPIDTFWYGVDVTHGRCLQQLEIFLTDTTVSVVSDLMILVLPVALISKLNMPIRKKVKVTCVLAAGGLACVVTVVRLAWVVVYRDSTDKTWTLKRIELLAEPEIAVGIICSCLPAIAILPAQLLRYIRGRYGSSVSSDSRAYPSPKRRPRERRVEG